MPKSEMADQVVVPYALLSLAAPSRAHAPLVCRPRMPGSISRSAWQSSMLRVMPRPDRVTRWLRASIGLARRSIFPVMTRSEPILIRHDRIGRVPAHQGGDGIALLVTVREGASSMTCAATPAKVVDGGPAPAMVKFFGGNSTHMGNVGSGHWCEPACETARRLQVPSQKCLSLTAIAQLCVLHKFHERVA